MHRLYNLAGETAQVDYEDHDRDEAYFESDEREREYHEILGVDHEHVLFFYVYVLSDDSVPSGVC